MKILRRLFRWGDDDKRPVSLSATTGLVVGIALSLLLAETFWARLLLILGGLALGISLGRVIRGLRGEQR